MARSMVQWADDDCIFSGSREDGNSSAALCPAYLGKDTEMPSGTDECVLLHGITLSDIADPEQKAAAGDIVVAAILCGGLCVSAVLGDKGPLLFSLLCLPPDPGGHCNGFAGALPGEKIRSDERQEEVGRKGLCATVKKDKIDWCKHLHLMNKL